MFSGRILSILLFPVFLFMIISSVKCTSDHTVGGYFEVQIQEIRNAAGEQAEGKCCDGPKNSDGKCDLDQCDTFVHACIKEYHRVNNLNSKCVFGSGQTSVLGGNVVNIPNFEDDDNPGRIMINLRSTWMRTFSILLKIKDLDNTTDMKRNGISEELIDHDSHRAMILPGKNWQRRNFVGTKAHVIYYMRVKCYPHYYGFNCTKFCQPRSGYFGHYTCDKNGNKQCNDGWMGKECKIPICKIGCNPVNGSCDKPYQCKCEYGWQGDLCNECVPYPKCEHGTCKDALDCNCDKNWGGLRCNLNLDYCGTYHPCLNGGVCSNPDPDTYRCDCPEGYTGERCETAEYACISNPCKNGGTCHNSKVRDFYCNCLPGWSGLQCEIDYDDCAKKPCSNNGTCTDLLNGFTCDCPPHWEGNHCQLDANECKDSPCVHATDCVNLFGNYKCPCEAGWTGKNCDIDIDDCAAEDVCYHGGVCQDMLDDFHCICPKGYSGKRCSININDCLNEPCMHGGQCIDKVGYYHCICPPGYSGKHCELNQGYCEPNPCENGALCFNLNSDYYCNCSDRYVGKNCSELKNECKGSLSNCEMIDSCRTRVPSNKTSSGYEVQLSTICGAHGTCVKHPADIHMYSCLCESGYSGDHCETNINDCEKAACMNGATCIDGVNQYTCICQDGFQGVLCSERTHHCNDRPCENFGTCVRGPNINHCECKDGWTGPFCSQRKVPPCTSNPCNNGGTCIDEGSSFSCYCREGFSGSTCEQNLDDCNPYPCYNRGRCVDGVNHYTCDCLPGFAGPDCRININECLSEPCAFGSICIDGINDYRCKCPPRRSGKRCEKVITPLTSCYSKTDGRIYNDGDEWNEVCNKCRCLSGTLTCTKFWCGPRICLTPKDSISCPRDLMCVGRSLPHCYSPPCLKRSVCLHPDDRFPTGGSLYLPESVLKCVPNSLTIPSRNCHQISLRFESDELSPGRYLEDICAEIRNISCLEEFALTNSLFIRCSKHHLKPQRITITFSSNTTNPADLTAKKASACVMTSYKDMILSSHDATPSSDDSQYYIPLICIMVAIICCIFFIVGVVKMNMRRRQGDLYRGGTRDSSSRSSVRDDEKSFTNCDHDPDARGAEECEMSHLKKRSEMISAAATLTSSADKNTSRMEKRSRDAAKSTRRSDVVVVEEPGDFSALNVSVAQRVSLNLSTVVSCERSSVPVSNHHVIPTTTNFRTTSQPLRLRTIEIDDDEAIEESSQIDNRYETSRLLPSHLVETHGSVDGTCVCESLHHQRHHSITDTADCPESEEVARYMSREHASTTGGGSSSSAGCHHNSYIRAHPHCDRHHSRRSSQQQSSLSQPTRSRYDNVMTSSMQPRHHRQHRRHKNQKQVYYADAGDPRGSGVNAELSTRLLAAADDAELPPYESVVVETSSRSTSHGASCDCCARHARRGRTSTTTPFMHPVVEVPSPPTVSSSCLHHQSPPPSYSRHCPQVVASSSGWRGTEASTSVSSSNDSSIYISSDQERRADLPASDSFDSTHELNI